jgi:hypothetical protein
MVKLKNLLLKTYRGFSKYKYRTTQFFILFVAAIEITKTFKHPDFFNILAHSDIVEREMFSPE